MVPRLLAFSLVACVAFVASPVSGQRCFPADGNELRAAVGTYVTQVQNLTTLAERQNHNLSLTYGYPIGEWCTRLVTNFQRVFQDRATFNEPLTKWNTSSATRMDDMFFRAAAFNQSLAHFDVSRVTLLRNTFGDAYAFAGVGLEVWDTSRCTNMNNLFRRAYAFNADVGGWDVSRVTNMKGIFDVATSFNQDISAWNVSLAVIPPSFTGATSFNTNLCAWGPRLPRMETFGRMFLETACPFRFDYQTQPFLLDPPGPLCYDCGGRPNLTATSIGRFEVPLVPVGVYNLPDGTILGWSAAYRYKFGAFSGRKKTFFTVFDPITYTATLEEADMGHDMFCPGTSVLPNGTLMVTGGLSSKFASLFDPVTKTWSLARQMIIGRGYQSQVTLSNGNVFVLGGSWNGGLGGKDGEVFDIATGVWSVKPGIPANGTLLTEDTGGILKSDNHMWLFEAEDGRIFHAGPSKHMHWLDLTGSGSIEYVGLRGDDDHAMNGGAVLIDENLILTLGGAPEYSSGNASSRAYLINISSPVPVVERLPDMMWPRAFVDLVILPNGWVVVAGGQRFVRQFSDADPILFLEIYDPVYKVFRELGVHLKVARNYHSTAVLAKDGRVVVGGSGLCGGSCDYETPYNHPDFEIITPPYLLTANGSLAVRPEILAAPSTFAVDEVFDVTLDISEPGAKFAMIRLGGATHSINLDQLRVKLTVVNRVGSTYRVRVPPNPVHVPPGAYWLFAMNSNGVPSVGQTMHRAFPGVSPTPPPPPTTKAPVTKPPTKAPVTKPPSKAPVTPAPVTKPPTKAPTTKPPTQAPVTKPPTKAPTPAPTKMPTVKPPTPKPVTKSPVSGPVYSCFGPNDNAVLITAIRDYINTPISALTPTSARNVYGPVIGNWCVDRLTNFNDAFAARSGFNEPLTNWNTSSATSMERMFSAAYAFNQNLSHFDTSRVTSMWRMFNGAVAFTGVGLPNWDVSRVGSMNQMFLRSRFNQDISGWNVRNVDSLEDAFRNVSHFNQNLCAWGPRLNSTKIPATSARLNNAFLYTGCPNQGKPSLVTNPRGPFCWTCT